MRRTLVSLQGIGLTIERLRGPRPLPDNDGIILVEAVTGLGARAVWVTIDPASTPPPTTIPTPPTSTDMAEAVPPRAALAPGTTPGASVTTISGALLIHANGYAIQVTATLPDDSAALAAATAAARRILARV